jgi:hypothetical protein
VAWAIVSVVVPAAADLEQWFVYAGGGIADMSSLIFRPSSGRCAIIHVPVVEVPSVKSMASWEFIDLIWRICGGTSSFRVIATVDDDVGKGWATIFRLFLNNQNMRKATTNRATPPTTMPTIAPVGNFRVGGESFEDEVAVGISCPDVNEGV